MFRLNRLGVLGVFVFMIGFVFAAYSNPSSNWQANQPTFNELYSGDLENYWPILSSMQDGQCNATTDFVVGIPPGGCSPTVVTSDLLAEQNVPVFCQLYAIKVNPLIKASSIKSISFKGDYPEGVRSVVFHPARAAVKSYSTLVGSPVVENIGYVVIILEQEKVEGDMAEWVAGNLTATMTYDAEEAYGVGSGDYYLEPAGEEWADEYMASSFWNGRGFLKAVDVGDGGAKVQIMRDKDNVFRTFNLKAGETSSNVYLPGFYCKAGLKLKLVDITTQEDMARLNVDGNDIWVRSGSKFLDGKCYVSRLTVRDNNDGEVSISCSGAGKIKDLGLSPVKVRLRNNDGEIGSYGVGDKFEDKFVAAYGEVGEGGEDFLVLGKNKLDDDVLADISGFVEESGSFAELEDFIVEYDLLMVFEVFEKGDVLIDSGVSLEDSEVEGDLYFSKSVDVVENELIVYFGNEKKEIGGTWAEEALYDEIVLARDLGKQVTQKRLMDLFLEKYPLSDLAVYIREMRAKMDGTDYSNSFANVYIGNEFSSISVVDFKSVGESSKSVDLRVGSRSKPGLVEIGSGDLEDGVNGVNLTKYKSIEVKSISAGKVRLYFRSIDKDVKSETVTLAEGERGDFDGVEVYVERINVKEVAHVSLIPNVDHQKSEADFSFKIGIEKRAIELSPERANKMIENLNETIAEWEDTVERLGEVVTTLKGACFATSAVLMIKNLASGASGEAAARSKVMEEYREKCATDEVYREMSRTRCYNELEGEIEAAIEAKAREMEAVNTRMESAQEGNVESSGGLFGGDQVVNNEKYRDSLASEIDMSSVSVDVGGGEEVDVSVSGDLSVSKLQAIMLYEEAVRGGNDVSIASSKSEMDALLRTTALTQKANDERLQAASGLSGKLGSVKADDIVTIVSKDGRTFQGSGKSASDYSSLSGLGLGAQKVQVSIYNGREYLLVLTDKDSKGVRGVSEVYSYSGSGWVRDNAVLGEFRNVFFSDPSSSKECVNPWPKGTAQVIYYETGENEGLPAIVPFDLERGWYAWVKNSVGGVASDSVQGYKDSGDVSNLYICNIGNNKIMESGTPDDLCQSFYEHSLGNDESVSCQGVDVDRLYSEARQAVREAQDQYGKSSVNILGENIARGEPWAASSGVDCQDFMSPTDCKLMFNVCDPVICPPSRCDFGGKFPVSDVIASGVIGSLVLCLPNADDGVFLPVCVSGVHAGLDSYLSILKSERDCLQHSIDSGELVGICDQITSVYKCEFFWKQLSPLMDRLIPSVIDYAVSGGRARGGGEYALASQAWENTKNSIDYFKDTYAQNAFKAFNIRSTQEVGSTFCKAFVGTSVPGSADFIDDLLAPESPSQFYATFSESIFTEATVPSTSQYKVYYHIYAGNDQGVQYKVYLKNPPATSYYASNPEVSVKSGFISAGSSADESIDFTAPSGYKELCVVINAKEECGFKQSSSSFALDYISDAYVEDQATEEDITTEKECISGSPSALSMASLNLQDGVEELTNPDIALRGVVRVCASVNPEAGVVAGQYVICSEDPDVCGLGFECDGLRCIDKAGTGTIETVNGRWKDVGYCGDASLRCWLDTDSVKDSLENIEALTGDSIDILDERRGLIDNTALDLEGVRALLSGARSNIGLLGVSRSVSDGLSIVRELDRVSGNDSMAGAGTNGDRAEALSLKASVYRLLTGFGIEEEEENEEVVRVEEVVEESDSSEIKDCNALCVDSGFVGGYFGGACDEGYDEVFIDGEECCCEVGESEDEEAVDVGELCRAANGERIIEIVREIKASDVKYEDIDSDMESKIGVKSLECLALMIARQGSNLAHCGVLHENGEVECRVCNEDGSDEFVWDDEQRTFGIMQVDTESHEGNFDDFDINVRYAIKEVLIPGYIRYKDGARAFGDKNYIGWEAALRHYGGWSTSVGDVDYVENVLRWNYWVEDEFPEDCAIEEVAA